ncbi:hypothetical protein [Caulobacter sp. Root343]|uniref:hypothetical protein n=1 Tax=Caulobacter sp. Root343 TaxID=1736520 RepID=UPI0006F6E28C|nr:hypothetical protein [Caulobacter sp. Root343]KQV66631.1 hypothetical protein ASC70_12420 [Caulobacter sp. Root343]
MTDETDAAAGLARLRKIRDSGVVRQRQSDGKETLFAEGADLQTRIDSAKADVKEASGKTTARTGYAGFDRN